MNRELTLAVISGVLLMATTYPGVLLATGVFILSQVMGWRL